MSKTARQAPTGYRPSGLQCVECKRAAEDCSRLDFAAMPPAGKRDADGMQRVACRCYVRADEPRVTGHPPGMLQDDSRELTAWLAGKPDAMRHARDAVATIRAERVSAADELCPECGMRGWHKLGCSQVAHERGMQLPATRDAGGVVTVCQRPCRCWPDGCADSVACPRHNRRDG